MDYNNRLFHDISTRLVKLINVLLMTIPFAFVWYVFYADMLWVRFFMRGHWIIISMYIVLYVFIGHIYDAFKISYNGKSEMAYSQSLSLFEVNVIMYIIAWLLIRHVPSVPPFLALFLFQIMMSVMWCILAQAWYFHTFPAKKTIIVWDMRRGISQLIEKYNLTRKYNVIRSVEIDECISDIDILNDADTVFIVGVHSHNRNIVAKYCLRNNIESILIPRIGDLIVASAKRSNILYLPILKIDGFNLPLEYMIIKRFADIVLSLIGIILLSPLFLITAICIKAEDKGPIIYKQKRLTRDRKEFDILKFRSMKTNAEEDGIARLSTGEDDDRITKVGRFIRRTRLDELPNLINILKGDISIVGPRAERPELASEYEKYLPEFSLRLGIKAGMTGYAQVYGKYNTEPYDKLLMDLMYIANASVFEDLKIIFATLKILFMSESTEGFDGNQNINVEKKDI